MRRMGIILSLAARDPTRLSAVGEAATDAGATVVTGLADVTDPEGIRALISGFDADAPIDLLIANAGILDGRRQNQEIEDIVTARRVFDINLMGALETVHAVLPAMQQRRAGQIVIVSSLAAFSPLADAPAYAASKAALLSYGLGLRDALKSSGIRVNVRDARLCRDSHDKTAQGRPTRSRSMRPTRRGGSPGASSAMRRSSAFRHRFILPPGFR